MDETTIKVSKLIRELHDEIGGAIPIVSIMTRAQTETLTEEEILEALDQLEGKGLISRINETTIEFL